MDCERLPQALEAYSNDSILSGLYILDKDSDSAAELRKILQHEAPVSVYHRLGVKNLFMMYCEGIPELLPAQIWPTIISEALSHNAEANMSAVVEGKLSTDLRDRVADEIKQIARAVSTELAGWLMVSLSGNRVTSMARSVQRVSEEELKRRTIGSQFTKSNPWEVRKKVSCSPPKWLVDSLDERWQALLSQSGCFSSDDTSFGVRLPGPTRPVTTPIPLSVIRRQSTTSLPTVYEVSPTSSPTKPTYPNIVTCCGDPPSNLKWNLSSTRDGLNQCMRQATGIESPPFIGDNDQEFIIRLIPTSELGHISLSLVRTAGNITPTHEGDIQFVLSLGGTNSGVKRMKPDSTIFTVILDPRSVFSAIPPPFGQARLDALLTLSVAIAFIH